MRQVAGGGSSKEKSNPKAGMCLALASAETEKVTRRNAASEGTWLNREQERECRIPGKTRGSRDPSGWGWRAV